MTEPTPAEIEQGFTWATDEMVNEIVMRRDDFTSTEILRALAAAGLLLPLDTEARRQYGRQMPNGLVLASTHPDPTHYRLNGPWERLKSTPSDYQNFDPNEGLDEGYVGV